MQSADTAYKFLDGSPSKEPDVAVVIAGHPRIYTVCSDDYAIPASSGDLCGANGFTTVRRYADFPEFHESKMKGSHPEGGGYSLGGCDLRFINKHTDAHNTLREMTDLAARDSYLKGNQSGDTTTLAEDLTAAETEITLTDGSAFVEGDVIYISQEAILLGSKSTHTFTGCTRGYLLTIAVPHLEAVKVYGFIPNLYRRHLYVYKGYQGLPLSSWIRMWGGVIDGVNASPGMVSLHAMAMAWETYGGRPLRRRTVVATQTPLGRNTDHAASRKIVRLGKISDELNDTPGPSVVIGAPALAGDYQLQFTIALTKPTGLGDGHFAAKVQDGAWLGIVNPLVNETSAGPLATFVQANVVKVGTVEPDTYENGETLDLAWSNATFSAGSAPAGSHLHPITLFLNFLASTGTGANGDYDAFKRGIGLAIPEALIDVDSFEGIAEQPDVPEDLATFFLFSKPEGAKPFFDEQLGKPFGWYMATGADGKIKLVRPKNPVKLYFSRRNNHFRLTTSHMQRTRGFYIPAGAYTGTEAAAALQAGLSLVTGQTFTVTYNTSTGTFTLAIADGTFSFSTSDAWETIGHTSASGESSLEGSGVAIFTDTSSSGDYNTLTINDLRDLKQEDTLDMRVREVWFHCNYDWSTEEFRQIHTFTDAQAANLGEEVEPYEIESKGLLRAFSGGRRLQTPFGILAPPSSGCNGIPRDVSASQGLDASDSFATLFAAHLFDRYGVSPVRLKAKLKWKFNRLEVGDNVKVTYAADGTIADYEVGSSKLGFAANGATSVTRIFEVISLKPVMSTGGTYIEAELLGHRLGG